MTSLSHCVNTSLQSVNSHHIFRLCNVLTLQVLTDLYVWNCQIMWKIFEKTCRINNTVFLIIEEF